MSHLYSSLLLHRGSLLIPALQLNWKNNNILEMIDIEDTANENIDVSDKTCDPTFTPETTNKSRFIRQNEIADSVRELNLSKQLRNF
ncbi:hypothetical protein AVEN_48165-1 [Araneus ventricosus]|uniref:Uncharacterized protein n=1 Tax=Araneus ventricosus TaxID=182803 RepID=A0A4Y2IJS6_ARAVE|nr:hypothetical protein AVEN_48165-1 [Araneus ventricosus]